MIRTAKRVTTKEKNVENEKYALQQQFFFSGLGSLGTVYYVMEDTEEVFDDFSLKKSRWNKKKNAQLYHALGIFSLLVLLNYSIVDYFDYSMRIALISHIPSI